MVLANTKVELGEPLVLEPISLAKESHHFLARLTDRQTSESDNQRCLQIGKSNAHLNLQIDEPNAHLTLQVDKSNTHLDLQIAEPDAHLDLQVAKPNHQILVQNIQHHIPIIFDHRVLTPS